MDHQPHVGFCADCHRGEEIAADSLLKEPPAPRVVGDVPVVMLLATLYDPSQELTVYPEDEGTPAS